MAVHGPPHMLCNLHAAAPLCLPCTGDTVVFERRGEERSVIYVTLVKAGEAPVDVGPPLKKRRVSRKQAVQRLD